MIKNSCCWKSEPPLAGEQNNFSGPNRFGGLLPHVKPATRRHGAQRTEATLSSSRCSPMQWTRWVWLSLILFACLAAHAVNVTCTVCGVRVAGGYLTLDDGRYVCKKDTPNVVLEQRNADEIFAKAKTWCHKTLAGYGSLPDQNITVVLQNKTRFSETSRENSAKRPDLQFWGETRSRTGRSGEFIHHIFLLSGLTQRHLAQVAVHEYCHTWLQENAGSHPLSTDAKEGFCDWIAYKFQADQANTAALAHILNNSYTHGQINAFVAAEKAHGFDRIIQWAKAGEDGQIDPQQLDRILVLREARPKLAFTATAQTVPTQPFDSMPVFARLAYTNVILKGLSGSASRRFALINDETFATKDIGKVRMGASNVVLRCLDIRESSVTVQIQGEAEPRTLCLSGTAR